MKHFIHIPKNAGMQIRHHGNPNKSKFTVSGREALNSVDYYDRFVKTMKKDKEATGPEHARWRDLKPQYQQNCFAIIRNPWSRVVSRYTFMMHLLEGGKGNIRNQPQYKIKTFEEFLESRHKDANKEFYWHRAIRCWYPAMDHISDDQGVVQCDILRTEHLEDEGPKFLDVPPFPRRRNVSNTQGIDYKTFYNEKTVHIIADWYKSDIEYFGFDFDTSATKNTYFTR